MIETVVESIRLNRLTNNRVVFLKELNGDRHLPIWIGEFEAQAIAMELQGVESPRPLPYDLMKSLVGELNGRVDRVVITELSMEVFYARIVVVIDGRSIEVDSRPSDAIALAVRAGAPILVEDGVMDRAGVSLDDDSESDSDDENADLGNAGVSRVDDEQLSIFRDFINTLDAEDFERGRGD